MGWQTTFTLTESSKGCRLVTDEVLSHILPGLENMKVSRTQYVNGHLLLKFSVGWTYLFM